MPYYFIQITDGFAIATIVFIWVLILWNIKLCEIVDKLRSQNNELKEKIEDIQTVCDFQEDLLKHQENSFTNGLD
jgi:hypothetical protein